MDGHFSRAAERALDKSDLPTAATSTPPAKSILEIIEVVRRYRVRIGHGGTIFIFRWIGRGFAWT